jgi:hypothetical protein
MLSDQWHRISRELRPGWWTVAWFAAWGYVVLLQVLR